MGQYLEQIVDEYTKIYSELEKKLKWKVSDKRTLMMVSSLYIMKGKSLNIHQFLNVSDYIKKNVGFFSTLKSSQRFTTAAMLDLRYENTEEKFQEFLNIYEKLITAGFRRGPFTYIAAQTVLNHFFENDNVDVLIERAMTVYKAMKKEHYFLTGDNDYPLAILLAQLDEKIEDMMSKIGYVYKTLNESGFRRGNDLQFLSHILSLQKDVHPNVLIERCVRLMTEFKQAGRSIKALYYPVIGLLSLLDSSSEEVVNVMNVYERLNNVKSFKWYKDMNFLLAVNFVVKDKVDNNSLINTGIQTTIESIIQAQQAATIAVLAGASAAATSSSN